MSNFFGYQFTSDVQYASTAALGAVDMSNSYNGVTAWVTNTGVYQYFKQASSGDVAATGGGYWSLITIPRLLLNASNQIDGSQISAVGDVSVSNGTAAAPSISFSSDADTGIYLVSANTIGFSTNGALRVSLSPSELLLASGVGLTMTSARLEAAQGANVASGTNIVLGADGNFFMITGTTTINTISAAGWQAGSVVVLMFNASVTVTNAGAGTGASLLLQGAANLSATANDTLSLIYNGTNWVEVCRSVN